MAAPVGVIPQSGDNQYGQYGTGLHSDLMMFNPGGFSATRGVPPPIPTGGNQPVGNPLPGSAPPGVVPMPANPATDATSYKGAAAPWAMAGGGPAGQSGGVYELPNGATASSTLYPGYTNEYYNWLAQQVGSGVQPFNLSTLLPSTGTATTPGQVNAPLTPLLQQLQQFYSTGTGGPAGSAGLLQTAQTGNPTDVGPTWDAIVKAQQQNISQNEAQIREQFASLGNLNGSPFGTALTNFGEQTTLDQNSLLAQMQQQASEAAAGRQMSAQTTLNQGATGLGTGLQTLDQNAIQNLIAQFQNAAPQNNPLLKYLSDASTATTPFSGQTNSKSALISAIGSLF